MSSLDKSFTGCEPLNLLLEEAGLNGARREERYPEKTFFGFMCSYMPEELVLAAGMEPLRLLPTSIQGAPAELPAYCCSLAKGNLSMAKSGSFKNLAGVGFAHTCDTMQCLGGIWKEAIDRNNTLFIVPPVILNAPGAARYYYVEAKNLLARLGELAGREPGDEDLQNALELNRKIRRLAKELDELRPQLPSHLVSALLRAGQVMPRREYAAALESVLPFLKQKAAGPGNRHPVLVSGPVLENDNLFGMVEELGGRVVADDTCTGYRHYVEPQIPGTGNDPLKAIISRYIEMPICPSRNRGLETRTDYLERLAKERRARAAIIIVRKYCEPHAWDSVPVAKRLRAAGLQVLVLELEGADAGGQERTRLQAFLESL
jgi:benzoyl-CoA reductase/2-hydroxyglutaryl-CoA dehydratase subunit BcrC/BadD/HgdB